MRAHVVELKSLQNLREALYIATNLSGTPTKNAPAHSGSCHCTGTHQEGHVRTLVYIWTRPLRKMP